MKYATFVLGILAIAVNPLVAGDDFGIVTSARLKSLAYAARDRRMVVRLKRLGARY